MATLTPEGAEILCQKPVALPLGLHRSRETPLHKRIRDMILKAKHEEQEGYESFEDADDFVVEDDPSSFDTSTPYEEHFDHLSGETYFPEARKQAQVERQLKAFQDFVQQQQTKDAQPVQGSPAPAQAEPPKAAPEV